MLRHLRCLAGFLLLFILVSASVHSAPVLGPTEQEALEHSAFIVVAEHAGYSKKWFGKIDYFHGPLADYRVIQVLKGGALPKRIRVRYDFHDGSPCLSPPDWKFKEEFMPAKGSRWVLFLEEKSDRDDFWQTYRGDYGRWPANKANIDRVKKLVGGL
jgi:hypothetical protein